MIGETEQITLRGVTLTSYRVDAGNPHGTLFMIHGLASNATRFAEFMDHTALKQWLDLRAVDLRGHGRSMSWRYFCREDWIADLHELASRVRRPLVLMGHSLGAQVALAYAARFPDQVGALVLIDPVFPKALHGALGRVARFRRLLPVLAGLLRLAYRLGLRRRRYAYRNLRELDKRTRDFLQDNPRARIADLYVSPLADLEYVPYATYIQDLYEVSRPLPDLDPVDAPLLVLLSAGASTADVTETRRMLRQLREPTIETIDADHWLLTERPRQAREVIEQWLESKRGEGLFEEDPSRSG